MAHMSKSKYILDDFAESLADIAVVDKPQRWKEEAWFNVFNCKNVKIESFKEEIYNAKVKNQQSCSKAL